MTAGFDRATLRRKRIEQGLTLAALGRTLGVTHQAVSRWEQGNTTPTPAVLPLLAHTLECSIDDLFTTAVSAPQ